MTGLYQQLQKGYKTLSDENVIEAAVIVEKEIFYKEETNFGILGLSVIEMIDGKEPELNSFGNFTAKGEIPKPKVGGQYLIKAKKVDNSKYGKQYQIMSMCTRIAISKDDVEGKRIYLETIFTDNQVNALYETLKDPYQTFIDQDVASLVKVKGVGLKTARLMLNKFNDNMSHAKIYVELKEYNLTTTMITRLLDHYGSPDLIVEKVRENPYMLMEVDGFGWGKCDALAMSHGMGKYSSKRIEAFITYYLSSSAEQGFTYVLSNDQLMSAIIENLGEDIPDEPIGAAIHHLGGRLWWSEDHERIGLKRYVILEQHIAEKLIELRDAENDFVYDGWEGVVQQKERDQGWEYTDQQKKGIQTVLENNIAVITGLAGTGKSTVVSAILDVLKEYKAVQCALAGKAAARMSEITGKEGYTIHRLLGYPTGEPEDGGFYYCESRHLDVDIIILDEVSMVNGQLFYSLLKAIEPGTKLIMLGDVGQLESIGCCNIAHDLIESAEIPSIELDKIHRQAAASAIITDSIKIRRGNQVINREWAGEETRGELKDLTYECYSDANNTFYKIMERVSRLIADGVTAQQMQVIVPMKERDAGTWNINIAMQELFNPSIGQKGITINYDSKHIGCIRVGDKVINVVNNYNSVLYNGQWEVSDDPFTDDIGMDDDMPSVPPKKDIVTPVFNGNVGIVKDINLEKREMIIVFDGIGELLIKADKLNGIMLGYAITVHKSQGSQADIIIFGCDFNARILLSRELLYTAITRAKKHCYVIAQNSALRYAVSQDAVSVKQTLLQDFLCKAAHPKLSF